MATGCDVDVCRRMVASPPLAAPTTDVPTRGKCKQKDAARVPVASGVSCRLLLLRLGRALEHLVRGHGEDPLVARAAEPDEAVDHVGVDADQHLGLVLQHAPDD